MARTRSRKLDDLAGAEISPRDKLLLALELGHSVRASCGLAGCSSSTYFRRRTADPAFALAADTAKSAALASVEAKLLEAIERNELGATIFFLKSMSGGSCGSHGLESDEPGLGAPPAEDEEAAITRLK